LIPQKRRHIVAKVDRNLVIMGLSGSLADQLVIQSVRGGLTIIRAMPRPSRVEPTPAQIEHRLRFKEATAYAKGAAETEPIYAEKAEGTQKSAYNVAVADWFHTPEILEIDLDGWTGQAGETVRIRAQDDVMVKTVQVVIADDQGNVVEQGVAASVDGVWWAYTTTAACPTAQAQVIVTAEDLPGHVAQATGEK
jgi:hypothetical protein